MPTFLENMGIDIQEGTPEYSSLIKYINNTSGGDIMSVLKTMGDIPMQTETPSLQTISAPGGEQVYTFGDEVISPDKVINPNALVTAKGFEPEFPIPYMIPYDDGGTPDDPSDDKPATRVQVTTVSKDPGGLKYGDDSLVAGGDQVYRNPFTKSLDKLDPTTMYPMTDSMVLKLQTGLEEDLKVHDETMAGIPKLQEYIDLRGQMSKAGAQRIVDDMTARLNALRGENLSLVERAITLGKAKFRSILGELRLEILGPGVLTEFDRQVIEEAIGGFGPFTTNEMAIEIVQNVINQRLSKSKIRAERYNRNRLKAGVGTADIFPAIDMSVYNIKPVFDPTRDLANDFKNIDEAEAFAKENNGTIFLFNGKPFQVE
jgi:hypothetical protein